MVTSLGLLPPDVVILPGTLQFASKKVRSSELILKCHLPEGLMERCCVACHDFGSALCSVLVENLVQDSFLLEPINIVWCLRCDNQVLLLLTDKAIVT